MKPAVSLAGVLGLGVRPTVHPSYQCESLCISRSPSPPARAFYSFKPFSTNKLLPTIPMSSILSTTTDSSTFKAIFDDALKEYEKKTGTNLTTHPLADKLRTCDSPDAVLNVLQEHARAYEESRNGDRRLMKLLDPTIHILYIFSAALGEGVGLVCSKYQSLARRSGLIALSLQAFGPAKVIFAGFSVLLAVCSISK